MKMTCVVVSLDKQEVVVKSSRQYSNIILSLFLKHNIIQPCGPIPLILEYVNYILWGPKIIYIYFHTLSLRIGKFSGIIFLAYSQ